MYCDLQLLQPSNKQAVTSGISIPVDIFVWVLVNMWWHWVERVEFDLLKIRILKIIPGTGCTYNT